MFKPGCTTLVTGGAGFIGSHVVDRLVKEGCTVKVYDDLSTGFAQNLSAYQNDSRVVFVQADLLDLGRLKKEMAGIDCVFHLAANADLKKGVNNTRRDLEQNTIATYNVLEAMRLNDVAEITFSSSSAAYGEPGKFPTPEDYCPTQNSLYGASKLAGEGLVEAYSTMFGFGGTIFRFVSVVGERYSHGIAYDLVRKMKANPRQIEVLGDGTARKSFVYVGDLVDAVFTATAKRAKPVDVYNIGNSGYTTVTEAARIIASEYGLPDISFKYTGGKVGWKGDAPFVFLDIAKIRSLGWEPRVGIEEGLRRTTRFLKENPYITDKHESGIR